MTELIHPIINNRWVAGQISKIMGNEDDVVIELCFNLLEGTRYVCALADDYPVIATMVLLTFLRNITTA